MDSNPYLDTHFDAAFDGIGLPWLPWVGSAFRATPNRTIILGESVYDYGAGDASVSSRILKRDSLRQRHLTHGIQAKFKSRYLRNFERAFFLKKKVSKEERSLLWGQVMYHNLVPRMMATLKDRPDSADYTSGWRLFLALARIVSARRCLVYGLEPSKIAALLELLPAGAVVAQRRLPAVGRNRPLALTLLLDGQSLQLLFIRHPSAFFTWSEWGVVLRQFLAAEAGNCSAAS